METPFGTNRSSPDWRILYESAITELDPKRFAVRIAEARSAILRRMDEVKRDSNTNEIEQLINALTLLGDLSRMAEVDKKERRSA